MDAIKRILFSEPVATQGLVQSGIAMMVGFGLDWTANQVALVLAFTAPLLALITRAFVTPTAKIDGDAA